MTTPDPILDGLNESQYEAVTWNETPLLILAGAGSGKTRILTRRIAYLIRGGVPHFSLLGVTFTNKAAGEMKARVAQLVSGDVWISTFHSTCLKILRQDALAIDFDPQFTIYDDQDQLTVIRDCLKELNINDKQVHPKGIRERIQRAKDYLYTPYQYAEKAEDLYEETVARVYQLYEDKLKTNKACDFGDLIMKTVLLFDRSAEVLAKWQNRFRYILIDEYQDTNHAQYRFVKLLASRDKKITVVGDPDQSVYAWRGANIRNILSFEKDYPECGIIKMERNYRSTAVILDAANEIIKNNRNRKPKELWTDREGGEKIRVLEARDEKEEARYVVDQVSNAVASGRTLSDQVIFYRVHAQSRVLEDALRRLNIPYKIVGGIRFYDRKEIKDLIAYLKVVAYPHDNVSFARILNVPPRGIGKKSFEAIEAFMRRNRIGYDEALKRLAQIEGVPPKAMKMLGGFERLLNRLRSEAKGISISELLQRIIEKTGYVELLEEERTVEAQSRIENIEEFFSVVEEFQNHSDEAPEGLLNAFLESISLVSNIDEWNDGTNVLTLMTLHTAKGLEFPVVYMVGMEEGIFPNVKAFAGDADELDEDLEEERRLCYVGVTRAKEKLHLCYARERMIYGSRQYNLPSRFLTEIPSELLSSSAAGHVFSRAAALREEAILDDDLLIEFDED